MMTETEFDMAKFDGKNDFGLWQVRMKAFPEQQGLTAALKGGVTCSYECDSQSKHIDEFHKLVGDLAAIDTTISDEDQALLLLTYLPSSYENFVETLLYGRDTLKLEDVLATLNSRELQKTTEAKGDGGEGLYVRGDLVREIWSRVHIVRGQSHKEEASNARVIYVSGSRADGYDSAYVMMAMSVEELLDRIMDSGGSYHITYRRDYLVDFEEYDVDNILLGDGRECHVRGTGKVQVQIRDVSTFVSNNVSAVYPGLSQGSLGRGYNHVYISSEQGMLEPVKVKCIFLGYHKGIVGNKLWRLDDVTSKVVLYRNMSFNESGEYKKTFISSGVGTGSMQVLQGDEFEVEPQDGHTFEVEPQENVDQENVDQGAGLQEVQTQDLIDYQLARNREQHLACELFGYREDSNETAFAVAAVGKIYAHESLNFNNTIACEVISKWKAGLKDDMDARSDVYMLNNDCKKCSDDNDGYYWEYTPGLFLHLFLHIDDMVFSCECKAEIWATKGLLDKANGNVLSMQIVLKSVTVKETSVKPKEQKLVLRGKEMDDLEHFHMVGVKGNTKVILVENLPTINLISDNIDFYIKDFT
ncbi:zinc finger, CCHC-type containing protein [Tanacetum coccineum]